MRRMILVLALAGVAAAFSPMSASPVATRGKTASKGAASSPKM
jgi:hypothetical protein